MPMGSEPEENSTSPSRDELARLQSELKATTERLRQEHQQHLQLETRQLNLMQSMDALLARVDGAETLRSAPPPAGRLQSLTRTLLTSLVGGILGGGLVLAVGPWVSSQRPMGASGQREAGALEVSPGGESQGGASQAADSVQFRCAEPCWLDIREADSGEIVFFKLLKGTANFAVGRGLDVFSGRADLVKVRINAGPEEALLPGRIVGSRVIRPSRAATSSP